MRKLNPWGLASCFAGRIVILVLFVAALAAAQSLPIAKSTVEIHNQPAISVSSELVVLPVSVTDQKGNFVPGLNAVRFRVYEDNRLQRLSLFQQGNTPVGVGLLVDHSASMRSKLPNVISAISAFAQSANTGDEMFVVDFNDEIRVSEFAGLPFTNDFSKLQNAVRAVSPQGSTALYDAIGKGLDHLRLSRCAKRALIIVSDGGDNASISTSADVLALARQSQVTIYSIGLEEENGKDQNPKLLRQMSKETGGLSFFPESKEAVMDVSLRIAQDLRRQYTLGFVPGKTATANAGFRKLRVDVTDNRQGKLHVRTRAGYTPVSGSGG